MQLNSDDMYAQDSIDLLTKSGIDFKKHDEFGIDVEHFGELLISSGFVLLDEVKWISFHRYMDTLQSDSQLIFINAIVDMILDIY